MLLKQLLYNATYRLGIEFISIIIKNNFTRTYCKQYNLIAVREKEKERENERERNRVRERERKIEEEKKNERKNERKKE